MNNAGAPAELRERLNEIEPLLVTRFISGVVTLLVLVTMLVGIAPTRPPILLLLSTTSALLFAEKMLVERCRSATAIDRVLATFALAHVVASLTLLHLASDLVRAPVLSLAINLVASGTALGRRALIGVTAFASIGFLSYAVLAFTGAIQPGELLPSSLPPSVFDVTRRDEVVFGLVSSSIIALIGLPTLTLLAYLMTARARGIRDALRQSNVALGTAWGEAEESRRLLDALSANLAEEVRIKTLTLQEQNRFLSAINAISFALNGQMGAEDSPTRLGRLVARLFEVEAVQIYSAPHPRAHTLNVVVPAEDDVSNAVLPLDSDVLREVSLTGEPVFHAPVERAGASSADLAAAVVPLVSNDGRITGALAALAVRPEGWSEQEQRLLTLVGRQLGVAFENKRLYEGALAATAREAAVSAALNALTRGSERSRAITQALDIVLEQCGGLFAAVARSGEMRTFSAADRSSPREDWPDYEALANMSVQLASLASDRTHPMVLGPFGEAPVGVRLLRLGVGTVIVAPISLARLTEGPHRPEQSPLFRDVGAVLVAMAPIGSRWGDSEAELLTRLAAGIGRRLENEALVEVQRRHIDELSALARLVTTLQATVDSSRLFHGFAQSMIGLVRYDHLFVLQAADEEAKGTLHRFAAAGQVLPPVQLGPQPVGSLWRAPQLTIWSAVEGGAPEGVPDDSRFVIAVPLEARSQHLGTVVIALDRHPRDGLVSVIGQAVDQLALALDSAALYRQASERAARIQVLGQLARTVASVVDLRDAFGVFADEVRWLVPFDQALVLTPHESQGGFALYAQYPDETPDTLTLPFADSITRIILEADQAIVLHREDPALAGGAWAVLGSGVREVAAVRVVSGGHTSAIFALTRHQPQAFENLDLDAINEVSGLLEVTIERLQLYEEAEYSARHDALTGLPNLRMLNEESAELERHIRDGGNVAVLVLDMDNLKTLNDTLGHEAGDRIIQTVAHEIRACASSHGLVARVGGDEFVVTMRDATVANAQRLADAIHDGLAKHNSTLASASAPLAISIGIAHAPEHGNDMRSLLRAADQAMYVVKSAGGGSTQLAGDDARALSEARAGSGNGLDALVEAATSLATPEERGLIELAVAFAMEVGRCDERRAPALRALRLLTAVEAAHRLERGAGLSHEILEATRRALQRELAEQTSTAENTVPGLAPLAVEAAWSTSERSSDFHATLTTAVQALCTRHSDLGERARELLTEAAATVGTPKQDIRAA